jgi:anthranilate/para-aminobenzoate synthase component II
MRVLIISNRPATDRAKENTLIAWLKTAGKDIIVDVANYAELDWPYCTKEWPHKYDGVVLGGFSTTRDKEAAEKECAALIRVEVPILGICGGMQDICKGYAQAAGHGMPVMKQVSEQRVNKHEHLEIPALNIHGPMKYIRRWGVIPSAVPSTLEILSLDAAGESVAAVRHRKLPILGFQGHPEYSPDPVSTQCLIKFFEIIVQHGNAPVCKTACCNQLLHENVEASKKRTILSEGVRCPLTEAQTPNGTCGQLHESSTEATKKRRVADESVGSSSSHTEKMDPVPTRPKLDSSPAAVLPGTASMSGQGASLNEFWQLTGTSRANVRNVPQGQGKDSIVVTTLPIGSRIEVLQRLGNDWVSIGAPAHLKGLCTRLRHGSGERVWSMLRAASLVA